MKHNRSPEARMHDFGTVARAANTEHRFYVKNNHSSDMHISSIRASCGCTTPIVETEWIKPGETGSILARFNTGTFTGKNRYPDGHDRQTSIHRVATQRRELHP
ncbi:MAG: DUF1573 domain-containing protein [Pirellulaceae bacterium]